MRGLLSGRYRWLICGLLFLATTINYVDRQILSLLKPILDVQLGWTNEQFGLVNSAFQAAYAFGLLGFGWVIDRYGVKLGYAVSITIWSLAAMGHALVSSLGGFLVARVCLGLGEGGNFPSGVKVVATWFPKKERALATSIFIAGSNVGALGAPAFVPWMALTWGWQSPFVAAGLAGLLWLFLWLPLYQSPQKTKGLDAGELSWIHSDESVDQDKSALPWLSLLGYRQTWAFLFAKMLTDPVWWFYLIWLPDYFNVTRHLDIKHSWVHLVTIYSLVTVLSIAGGWFTGKLIQRGWTVTRARKTGMLIYACCVLPVFFTTWVGDWTAVILIGFAGAAHQSWSANLYTTVSDMFPKHAVGSVVGLGSMVGSVSSIFFPLFTGKLLDVFKARGDITGGYTILFGICSMAYLVAFALNHLCAPTFAYIKSGSDVSPNDPMPPEKAVLK
jgi:ACS family hexuronate transporter-like MFS transporter